MTTHRLLHRAQRNSSAALLAVASLLMLTQGCGGNSNQIAIKPEHCPLPPHLADEQKNTVKQFSAEVSGLAAAVAGGKVSGDIQGTLEKYYPSAHDVNRIYALSYAACVSCRLDPKDVKSCADGFHAIINANHAKRDESVRTATEYHKQMLTPLQGGAASTQGAK